MAGHDSYLIVQWLLTFLSMESQNSDESNTERVLSAK